ncbi:hypothetical protein HF086_010904 [Spodoptera exigua]|uniref:Peptidase S1 domain-containing protein n=1 Tax=Spodoptera exigua TaxID=7107 RepID=A0A922MIV2_SPOEX|nr:hypothetical protein HF086_010904 [Spodoptera exigua]
MAAGWGTVAEGKNHSCYLQEVDLPILSNEACKNANYTSEMIGDGMLCAGYPEVGKKDTCQGDSGGPLSAERSDKRHEQLDRTDSDVQLLITNSRSFELGKEFQFSKIEVERE